MTSTTIRIPAPDLQVDFFLALAAARREYLQDALRRTVQNLDISRLDDELSDLVPPDELRGIAGRGLRGELLFAVPYLLNENPKLLGYYRLLLGFSQKAFYTADYGTTMFKAMEERGLVPRAATERLAELCKGLITAAVTMVRGIGVEHVSRNLLDDLTLLTLGPQLRGGANVTKGKVGIKTVFKVIHDIVGQYAVSADQRKIEITNAAERKVLIEFASDPDIIIRELMALNSYRNLIAIEVKGGTDFSNIHNRLGEAEKSHQKARQAGFVECWTVTNVDRIDLGMARRESPTTNRFYRISQIMSEEGEEFEDFRNRIISSTGIPTPGIRER